MTRGTFASPGPNSGSIVQRGKGYDLLRPLSADPELCLKFASLEQTPTACLEFAKRWGFLEKRPRQATPSRSIFGIIKSR